MLKPVQCRAARTLIGIDQAELAKEAGVNERTITDFERGERSPHKATLKAIADALERRGVGIIQENGGGIGVRVKEAGREFQPKPRGKPE